MKIKLMVLLPLYGYGGTEKVLSTIVENIDKNIFDVTFVILDNNKEVRFESQSINVRVIDLECNRVLLSGFKIRKVINEIKPDLVLTGQSHLNLYVSMLKFIGFIRNSKLIIRESIVLSNNLPFQNAILKIIYKKLVSFFYRKADKIIAQSDDMLNDLNANFHIDLNKLVKINNPIKEKENVTERKLLDTKRNILAIGRLVPQKGFDRMLRIISKIKGEDFKLYICGDGSERTKLESMIVDLGIQEKIELLGMVPNPSDYLKEVDLLIMSSYYEGFPNVLLEAGIAGIPVVCFECLGGVNEIMKDGLNGFMIKDNDEDEFAEKIMEGLSTSFDRDEIIKITLSNFSLEKIMETYKTEFVRLFNEK